MFNINDNFLRKTLNKYFKYVHFIFWNFVQTKFVIEPSSHGIIGWAHLDMIPNVIIIHKIECLIKPFVSFSLYFPFFQIPLKFFNRFDIWSVLLFLQIRSPWREE